MDDRDLWTSAGHGWYYRDAVRNDEAAVRTHGRMARTATGVPPGLAAALDARVA